MPNLPHELALVPKGMSIDISRPRRFEPRAKGLLLAILLGMSLIPAGQCAGEGTGSNDQIEELFLEKGLPAAYMRGFHVASGESISYALGAARNGDEIYRIASMTKIVTTVAALQLVEQGKVTLDQPLNAILPDMASAPVLAEDGSTYQSDSPISLRQLLTHTSGFAYRFTSDALHRHIESETAKEHNRAVAAGTRIAEPGTKFCYGISHDWVGRLVEALSKKSLEEYFRDHVTGPLKMDATWFNPPERLHSRIVARYKKVDGRFETVEPRLPSDTKVFRGGGGLFSSPNDYVRFLTCLYHDGELNGVRVLGEPMVELLFRDQLPAGMAIGFPDAPSDYELTADGGFERGMRDDRWSFGWALDGGKRQGVRSAGAAYWAGFLNSYYTIDRKQGVIVVFFCQYVPFDDSDAYELYRTFEREVYLARNR